MKYKCINDNCKTDLNSYSQTEYRVSIRFVLITLLAISTSMFSNTAFSIDKAICNAESNYIKRRLGSEQEENICQTHMNKVMLIVNTASRCAYTNQYDGLEKLYAQYKHRGLVVLGFPSNDFGNQEPGNEQSIKSFCRLTYGVKFPMYAKTKLKGNNIDKLYTALEMASGEKPRWNFHKYLIDRNGYLIGSYSSSTKPDDKKLIKSLEKALAVQI